MIRFAPPRHPTALVSLALAPVLILAPLFAPEPGERPAGVDPARPATSTQHPPARLHCAHPGALRLRRFEDGSARLECARRLLATVSVPG